MKPRLSISIALTLMLSTLEGQIGLAQSRPILARMIQVRGTVELKKEGSLNWRPTKEGETLFHGDLLRVQRGSRGVLRCTSDLTEWMIPDDGLPRGVANTCSAPKNLSKPS